MGETQSCWKAHLDLSEPSSGVQDLRQGSPGDWQQPR